MSSPRTVLGATREPERVELAGHGLTLVADRWEPRVPSRGALVLLPGGGQTRHSWDRAASELSEGGWTTWTLDARGHGESDWAPRAADYGIPEQAADLEAALRDVRRRDSGWTALIGASMGGMTALQYAATHPSGVEAVDALVLVDITPDTEPAGVARIRAFMDAGKRGYDSLDEVVDAVAAYRPGSPRRSAASLQRNVRHGQDGRWYWHWDPEFHRPDNGLADREANRRAMLSAAPRVLAPSLVLRGEVSDVVSIEGVAELLAVLPRAEAKTIPGAGHMVVGDDNSTFLGAVNEFLERHAPAPGAHRVRRHDCVGVVDEDAEAAVEAASMPERGLGVAADVASEYPPVAEEFPSPGQEFQAWIYAVQQLHSEAAPDPNVPPPQGATDHE